MHFILKRWRPQSPPHWKTSPIEVVLHVIRENIAGFFRDPVYILHAEAFIDTLAPLRLK